MKTITLEDRVIYRAENGKKVKFLGDNKLYSEIVVNKDDKREVEEIDNGKVQ